MSLFTHILIYNLMLSVYLYATLALDPRMWLHRMPPQPLRQRLLHPGL